MASDGPTRAGGDDVQVNIKDVDDGGPLPRGGDDGIPNATFQLDA
jgi:hypothetical protein